MSWLTGPTPTVRLLLATAATGAIALTLFAANSAMARREAQTRPATAVLRELVPAGVTAADIVAIELVDGAGRRVEFVREIDGLWRCIPAHGALADPARVTRLLTRTLGGGGMVRTSDPAHSARYGLDGPASTRMILHRAASGAAAEADTDDGNVGADRSADREVVLDLEIGLSLGDVDQCFVRLHGTDDIIAMEADIRRELRPDGPGGLPMIETHLLPSGWPGLNFIPRQIVILRRGELPLEIRREDIVDEAGEVTGWRWFRRAGDGDFQPSQEALPMMYIAFLSRARITGIIGPDAVGELGFENPIGRVLLGSEFTEPMELRVAAPQEWGTPVYGSFARTVSVVSNEVARLMLPGPEIFDPLMVENPWAAYTDGRAMPPGVSPDMLPPEMRDAAGAMLETTPDAEPPPREDTLFGPGG